MSRPTAMDSAASSLQIADVRDPLPPLLEGIPRSGPAPRSLLVDLATSFRNPEFWTLSSWLDIVVNYRQSRLGMFWILAPALVYIWGLGSYLVPASSSVVVYASHVALGFAIFRLVNSVITESTTTFTGAQSFILDGHVCLTDFVLRVVAKALFYFVMWMPVVASVLVFYPGLHPMGLLLALGSMPLIVLNLLWIAVVFALVGARFPDLSQFISNIFIFAFLLTPITWYSNTMPPGSMRQLVMKLNPIYHMVEVVRAPILGEALQLSSLYYLAIMTAVGWLIAILVYRRYARFVPIWI